MSKSFHSQLRDSLDEAHMNNGHIASAEHYRLKKALRTATMKGRQFQDENELAEFIANGMRFQS